MVSTNVLNAEPGWRWPCGGEVEGAVLVGAARRHRADVAVRGSIDDDRRARVGRVVELAVDRLARPAVLQLRVDRRVDLQPAAAVRRRRRSARSAAPARSRRSRARGAGCSACPRLRPSGLLLRLVRLALRRCSRCRPSARSTSLRRSSAARGFWNGLYCDGACGRPASSADSSSVEVLGVLGEEGHRRGLDADRGARRSTVP